MSLAMLFHLNFVFVDRMMSLSCGLFYELSGSSVECKRQKTEKGTLKELLI